jgi:hypothetical protein
MGRKSRKASQVSDEEEEKCAVGWRVVSEDPAIHSRVYMVEDAADAARKAFRDWKAMECVILRSVISGQEEFFQRNQVISAGHSKARDKSRRKERQFKSSLFSDDF